MRAIIIGFLALILVQDCIGQRKKLTNGNVAKIEDGPLAVKDTLTWKLDTTKVQFRLWIGTGYDSYLARVNGYLVNRTQVGKMFTGNRQQLLFDDKWKPIRPADIDPVFSPITLNW
jgi:hypothetical protein